MAIVETVLLLVLENSSKILIGLGVSFVVYLISSWFSQPKVKNPFENDCRRPHQGFIHDKNLRDKVIKQGFAQKKIPQDIDAIIIGSGIGSLTTAAIMGKSGKKALVLEQHDQAGGCCHTFVDGGYEFDAGIHYVGKMQCDSKSSAVIGQITEGQLLWEPLADNFDTVVIGKPGNTKHYPLVCGENELKQCLIEHFPKEVDAIEKFCREYMEAARSFKFVGLLKLLPKWISLWILRLRLLDLFTKCPKYTSITTQEYVDSITTNSHLKAVLSYIGFIVGALPEDSGMIVNAIVLEHYTLKSSYPKGGSSEIAMTIVPVIEKYGGKVLVRATVTDILMENGKAVGVRVKKGGEHIDIRAETIISGCGITNTMKLLPEAVAASTGIPKMLDDGLINNGIAGFCLFVGLNGTTESLNLSTTNIIALQDPDWSAASKRFMEGKLDFDNPKDFPAVYISFQSVKDAAWTDRYDGKSACTVFGYVNWDWFKDYENEKVKHRGEEYEKVKDFLAKQMMSQVFRLFPQLEDKVAYLDIGSPVTNNYYIGATVGEYFGLSHDLSRFKPEVGVHLRPDIGIPGLYLTGKDIACTGLSGGMESGLLTSSVVLKRNIYRDLTKLRKKMVLAETESSLANEKPHTNGTNGTAKKQS